MSIDPTRLWSQLDELGEEEVRLRLARRLYSGEKEALVHEWLRRCDAERAEDAHRAEEAEKAIDLQLKKQSHKAAWVSNVFSGVALLLSAASFVFSYLAYRDSHSEPLLLRAARSTEDYKATLEPSAFPPPSSGDLITDREMLLANNGQQAVSVLSLDIRLLTARGEVMYTGFVNAVLDDQLRPTGPPWALDAGKSLKLLARLKLHIDPKAYAHLHTVFPDGQLPSLHSAELLLADHELDFWGDSLTPFRSESKVIGFRVETSDHQPTVAFVVRTARGTVAADTASWYPSFNR